MLALTENAAEAVRQIVAASPDVPDESGVRIFAHAGEGEEVGLGLAVAEAPLEGDQVIEDEGARVFVGSEAAPYLDDKVLDASVVGERIQFSLGDQA